MQRISSLTCRHESNIHPEGSTAWCQHVSAEHKVHERAARRHSRNKGPSTRGHGAEENPEDLGGVWGMYVFGNGLASCVCERVRLCLCHQPPCMTQRLCVCVSPCMRMRVFVGRGRGEEVVERHCCVGSYWFSWGSQSCKCHGSTALQRTAVWQDSDTAGGCVKITRNYWKKSCILRLMKDKANIKMAYKWLINVDILYIIRIELCKWQVMHE